jgi:RNA polymerase sigma-70 factor (ECF subfamily)
LLQETLLVLHSKRDSYDRALPFTPWACAIARYKLADYIRRNHASGIQVEDTGDLFVLESPEPDSTLTRLARLPEHPPARRRAPRIVLTRLLKRLTQVLGVGGRRPRV